MRPSDSFSSWLKASGASVYKRYSAAAIGGVAAIGAIIALVGYLRDAVPPEATIDLDEVLRICFYLHFLIILIALLWTRPKKITLATSLIAPFNDRHGLTFFDAKQQSKLETECDRANSNVEIFYHNWLHIWRAWLALYVIFLIGHIGAGTSIAAIPGNIRLSGIQYLGNVFNNLASVMILRCFVTLSEEARINEKKLEYGVFSQLNLFFWLLTAAEGGLRAIALELFDSRLFISPDVGAQYVNQVFSIISGLLACIATAQLAGRFDSKLIGARVAVISLLYAYAGIQLFMRDFFASAGAMVLPEVFHKHLEIMVFYLALFFKCCLLLFVFWLIETKRLFFYFFAVHKIHQHIQNDWRQIREMLVVKENIQQAVQEDEPARIS